MVAVIFMYFFIYLFCFSLNLALVTAARVLGITRASIAATVGLVFSSPGIQGAVLNEELTATRLQLLPIVATAAWAKQETLIMSPSGRLATDH